MRSEDDEVGSDFFIDLSYLDSAVVFVESPSGCVVSTGKVSVEANFPDSSATKDGIVRSSTQGPDNGAERTR